MRLLSNLAFSVLKCKYSSIRIPSVLISVSFSMKARNMCSSSPASKSNNNNDEDLPDPNISNPYLTEKPQCILCRYQIQVDYKNVRLLSQFVSPYTGRLYDKHITGLCEKQHRAVKKELFRATKFGLISMFYRDPKYNNDPKLFNPARPQRANPY